MTSNKFMSDIIGDSGLAMPSAKDETTTNAFIPRAVMQACAFGDRVWKL